MVSDRTLIRGDSYALRRPLWRITFVNGDLTPYDLRGCTVLTTYKVAPTDPVTDPGDAPATALIRHGIAFDPAALYAVPLREQGLVYVDNGVIVERLTPVETLALPRGLALHGDVQLIDSNGEVFTWLLDATIAAVDGYTNRTAVLP